MYFDKAICVNINELLSTKHKFYAHLKNDKAEKETLEEHTDLCIEYFYKIVKDKNLEKIFLNFEESFFENISDEGKELFRQLLINIISFHDVGKINPIFQKDKMNNLLGENIESFSCIKSEHSILSAIIYLDCFVDKVLHSSKEDRNSLLLIIMFNAYIISKHHSSLDRFNNFLEKFEEDKIVDKIIDIFIKEYKDVYEKGFTLGKNKIKKVCGFVKKYYSSKSDGEKSIYIYTYEKLMYSLLVACDFYATGEFMNGTRINSFGDIEDISEFYDIYKNTNVNKWIREYEKNEYKNNKDLTNERNINILRNEMFLDAERELIKNNRENIYYLEAPTGSGKTNVAFNLSFKLFQEDKNLKKIYYVYPFNTLVEQNLRTLNETFGENKDVFQKIAIINSIYPIKTDEKYKDKNSENEKDYSYEYYAKALLNRQFLNYPIILTTHVSLFNTMFNSSKEDCFGFHQLANSVIVLDEIQSYKNTIWAEIISFLKGFARILNIKVIIMSATLPELNLLAVNESNTCTLIKNREKFFNNPLFRERVKINYELIDSENQFEDLYEHVLFNSQKKKKILIEFIKKQSAYEFFKRLKNEELDIEIHLMTGDDNSIERNRIISRISSKEANENGIILVSTQVIEAGVDIDMDIGYKDISKLDSDEQFMGRINRSCRKNGEVIFFNLDRVDKIYKNDFRVNKELSLLDESMKSILKNKNFDKYYAEVLRLIKAANESLNDKNLEVFFKEDVWMLNFKVIENRMKLIEDNNFTMSIYLARELEYSDDDNLIKLNGEEIWREYKYLLRNNKMDFAEKEVRLSKVRSHMNYFIYEINKNIDLPYNDKVGELYYIENGEKYFKNGKLDKEKFKNEVGMFIGL